MFFFSFRTGNNVAPNETLEQLVFMVGDGFCCCRNALDDDDMMMHQSDELR